ncbi:MAG TPA: hypothetical protein VIL72_04465 [Beijerinckiaceae bacterium]
MRRALSACLLACCLLSPALGQTPEPDWRELLPRYYRYDVAFDSCDEVRPSGGDMLRLEAIIDYVERRTGLSEDALDELYATIEYEAEADKEGFCRDAGDAVQGVRETPESWR